MSRSYTSLKFFAEGFPSLFSHQLLPSAQFAFSSIQLPILITMVITNLFSIILQIWSKISTLILNLFHIYLDQTRWDWGWELFTISLIQCVSTITAAGYTCFCSRQNSSTPGMVLQPRV